MSGLAEFVEALFTTGRLKFDRRPEAARAERERALPLLRRAFDDDSLDLPGPPMKFDESIAVGAAEFTRRACWFLVSRSEPGEVVEQALSFRTTPRSPGQHLSADLTFRYLPLVHRRARSRAPNDLLTTRLAEVLRRWPLSGVLSDVQEAPEGGLDLGGHAGLMMRYAERLADKAKPAWLPPSETRTGAFVELVAGSGPYLAGRERGRA